MRFVITVDDIGLFILLGLFLLCILSYLILVGVSIVKAKIHRLFHREKQDELNI